MGDNNNNNNDSDSSSSPDIKRRRMNQQEQKGQSSDEQLARKLQNEEDQRYRRLKSQYEIEQRAEKVNQYVKKQRVLYYSKLEDKWVDAVVVGVHFDDGPDKPYYTIKFKKTETHVEDNGNETTHVIEMEKQTDAERLDRVPWDEEKSWEIIK